jgi:hypothetical protein
MAPYGIPGAGQYRWVINNGLCMDTSGTMRVSENACNACQDTMTATLACIDTSAASYSVKVIFSTPDSAIYVLGTDIGPISPFTGVVGTAGTYTVTLTFTTLILDTIPDSVTVEMLFTYPSGAQCFKKTRVHLPHPCGWVAERGTIGANAGDHPLPGNGLAITNALMVFPNPSSGIITVSYDYGSDGGTSHLLSVYDITGRKMQQTDPGQVRGSWQLSTADWAAGMYVIRMEGDGRALQVQRVVVIH